jgi:hypothetical protein
METEIERKEVKLPSGAILSIGLAPFKDGRALYQAVFDEMKFLKLDPSVEIDANFYKDLFCMVTSSKKIEVALWKCMEKSLYNRNRITEDTFEPEGARDDYMTLCYEIAKENIFPFAKSLYAQYGHILGLIRKDQA